ncbi:LysR family transcriptional regulator [Pseudomonas alcaligenes]|uniref:LysR family transcriptional regulator n=1 Tax=Aquipseudomonas alcaligenes TaxID=43263 RepID=A0ABR7S3W9_AQUAC|nr:LysR family transcriptional regulator [Pseudomonas alcaligenes]MBC9251814.1 LysR family transcriptional regulator [Pseudomonas alcaligenes]
MTTPDLNLLLTLDVLLAEGSVARAAQRLQLSPSAMSRALARLRASTGDPLLVRAGRGLVPTPRALQLREQVSQLVQDAQAALRPQEQLDLGRLRRRFTLRTSDGFVENFGASLLARIAAQAPGVQLRFVTKTDKDSRLLREGSIDLDTGVIGAGTSPELHARVLFHDRFIGVVRPGHPLCQGELSAARYAAGRHVLVSRTGEERGPLAEALAALGLQREIVCLVGGFSAALALARTSELIASVPQRHTANLRDGLHSFALPFATSEFPVSMLWHPRMDADPAQRWLRDCVRQVCAAVDQNSPS